MWNRPWRFTEGFLIGGGLLVVGIILQATTGEVNWDLFAWPVNLIIFIALLALLGIMYILRKKVYVFQWLMQLNSAVPAISWALGLTIVMGLTAQIEEGGMPWLSHMLSFWPFVLAWTWVVIISGLTTLNHILHFNVREIPFLINHLGVFLAITAGTLGNADVKDMEMAVNTNQTQWIAQDMMGNEVEMDLAIELHKFTIDEYPPRLIITDNSTGKRVDASSASSSLTLEDGIKDGELMGWTIQILQELPQASSLTIGDEICYEASDTVGSTFAALVEASKDGVTKSGWISCGSYSQPKGKLDLGDGYSITMPAREPRRYASDITVYTRDGKRVDGVVEVNKPLKVNGWKIYQYSYDDSKGKWSDVSIFELVSDRWIFLVYAGILMMLAGAVCLIFFMAPKPSEKEEVL